MVSLHHTDILCNQTSMEEWSTKKRSTETNLTFTCTRLLFNYVRKVDILCSSRYLGLFYVFETIFQSRYHYDEDRFILSMISQILQGEIGHDKKTLETDNTINDHGCI